MKRREFCKYVSLAMGSLGLSTPMMTGCFSGKPEKNIRFDGWGGVVSEAFRKHAFEPFTAATGIEVIDGEFGDMDSYLTRVKASFPPGGEYNLAHISGLFDYSRYIELGLGVDLNVEMIPNLKNVMPSMLKSYRGLSEGKLSAVPFDFGQTGIAYNLEEISKEDIEKKGVEILWDESFNGKISNWSDWRTNIWYAALYTQQNPNKIEDINLVWEALRAQQKMVRKYWNSGAELMSLLANREVFVTPAWSGRVAALQQEGHPIGYYTPQNCYSWQECIFVIKGTNLEYAYKLLDFLLDAKCAIAVAEAQNYPPCLDPRKVKLPETIQKLPAFDPTGKLENYLFADPEYWNARQLDWSEQWSRIKGGL